MTKATANWVVNSTDDAAWRVSGGNLSALLDAIGMAKTADTGQIDWVTSLRPAAGTFAGYEVRSVTDALGTYLVKVEYGSYGGSVNALQLAFSFGGATDGAGNFGANLWGARVVLAAAIAGSASVQTSYACKTSDGMVALRLGSASGSLFCFERRRGPDGSPVVGDIASFGFQSQGSSSFGWPGSPTLPNSASPFCCVAGHKKFPFGGVFLNSRPTTVPFGVTTTGGTDVWCFGWMAPFPRMMRQMVGVSYVTAEIATGTEFSLTQVDGSTRTYKATGQAYAASGSASYSAAMIWE